MLQGRKTYAEVIADFRWDLPKRYSIAVHACEGWAIRDPERLAILARGPGGDEPWSYARLSRASNRLANGLAALGVNRGDRVAILLPQSAETAVTHFAVYKIGAIALPLAALFGVEALAYRLIDADVRAIVTNASGLAKLNELRDRLPNLVLIISVDGLGEQAVGFDDILAGGRDTFVPVDTGPDDPAMMIYTSGTTGPPKGALHGHRVLLGHLPGFQFAHEFFPKVGDRMWTPADWAWAGGLLNALMPSLALGIPVIAHRFEKFDPEQAFDLIAKYRVRNAFLPPTALKMLRGVEKPRNRFQFDLRTIGSAGEALGSETYEWAKSELGLTVNEFYGQTECNIVLGSCAAIGVTRAGAIGMTTPGHRVAIIGSHGQEVPHGSLGQIAVKRPDPVMFLGYWGRSDATAEKFIGDWMTTGDQGIMDEEGYVFFVGRDDDVITSAGYRIGPAEIEDSLASHPAVALAAVVGKPDELRTEIVKAYVKLRDGFEPLDTLSTSIRDHVRTRLSAHEYPREIAFVADIPLTTSGKVIRRFFRQAARAEVERDRQFVELFNATEA